MVPRGWSCWAVDLRGMGRSDGRRGHVDRWQQWIDDAAAFQRMVEAEASPLPVVPLGHSFGGLVVLTAVEREAIRPPRFVLSNPALRIHIAVPGWKRVLGAFASRAWPTLTMANQVDPAHTSRDAAVVADDRADPLAHDRISARLFAEWNAAAAAALAGADRLRVPSLLLLSGDDRIVDVAGAQELARRAAAAPAVRVYPDRFHEPFNDLGADAVYADLAEWLGRL
jgi:alpha-beta hydrolase superfamily lysophospholipase